MSKLSFGRSVTKGPECRLSVCRLFSLRSCWLCDTPSLWLETQAQGRVRYDNSYCIFQRQTNVLGVGSGQQFSVLLRVPFDEAHIELESELHCCRLISRHYYLLY